MASCSGRVALFQRIGGSIIPDRRLSLTGLVAQLGVEYPVGWAIPEGGNSCCSKVGVGVLLTPVLPQNSIGYNLFRNTDYFTNKSVLTLIDYYITWHFVYN